MKLLHTGDWHLGKTLDSFDLIEDQKFFLRQFIQIAIDKKPDVILIAGDIYDRSLPPTEAVMLLNEVLTELIIKLKIKTILIAGNHDSSERLGFANDIMKAQGLFIFHRLEQIFEPITLEDEDGSIDFYGLPFIHPVVARHYFEDQEIKSFQEVYAKVLEKLCINRDNRNVLMTHGYITGSENLEESESERRLTIGGTEYVEAKLFEHFDYVALGHLHGPQKVSRETMRYSGSPIKYSFSELNHKKSVAYIELVKGKETVIELLPLVPLRDMREIKGELQVLIRPEVYELANREDYLKVILTDKDEVYDAMNTLRQVYPHVLRCDIEKNINNKRNEEDQEMACRAVEQLSPLHVFKQFYLELEEETLSDEQVALVTKAIETASEEVEL